MARRVRNKIFAIAARILTKPRGSYNHHLPNDLESLRRGLRLGDVVLVDGEQRISEVIKYLTQSSWSHSALYVGDELLRRHPEQRAALRAAYGRDAEHMMIEALYEGVLAAPVTKYAHMNLRVCRPRGLQRDDLRRILDEVISQLGQRYDLQNIWDLARYFFPVSLIPRRFRRRALEFGSGLPTQVICSSLIGRAFQNVGFPILPSLTPGNGTRTPRRWSDRLLRRTPPPYATVFRRQLPSIITPRDFDLSPYFEVVKFHLLEVPEFDYRRIQWAESEMRRASGKRFD
ncbi:MAG TPA: YiiX/YebB-like N1pC/P60 family cysteine hydrolase [Candidatus Binatus sp.]|jgi:Permuted papain-like amidase enzyme, YaeF/YiiX, C92 family|nr:YiiX/YebB-like N1pC/P60 family cysteine hydrolase [Candidatus Binatus sp.]